MGDSLVTTMRYCGQDVPSVLEQDYDADTWRLTFVTDNAISARGFRIRYRIGLNPYAAGNAYVIAPLTPNICMCA